MRPRPAHNVNDYAVLAKDHLDEASDGLDRGSLLIGCHGDIAGWEEPERTWTVVCHGRTHGHGCATS